MRQLDVRLTPWQRRRLQLLRDHAPSARLAKRAMCLLRSAAGERACTIARVTGLSADAVTDIRRRWSRHGLRSLADRARPGRPSRVTDSYRREVRRAVRRGPFACGYVFTAWSVARLRAYLRRRTGIDLGVDRLRRVMHGEGTGVGRPKHTLKGKRDPREYADARRRLERLKKGRIERARLPTSCGAPTRPSSSCCRTWSAAGGRGADSRRSGTPGVNKKVAAFGAVCHGCGLFLHHTQPRATAWGVRRLVQRLLRRARRTHRTIVLVLDRGNPNHAHAPHRDPEAARPHIEVFWLPHYCWNPNLIERLWKHLKASRVANALFESLEQFVEHVDAALEDFAKHPDLTLSVVSKTTRTNIRKNLVRYT